GGAHDQEAGVGIDCDRRGLNPALSGTPPARRGGTSNPESKQQVGTSMFSISKLGVAVGLAVFAVAAQADITVGVNVSATGPAASLGIPEKNTFSLMPKTIAGQKVNYIVLDDASDTTTAVKNARRFVTEDKVDVMVGSTITPNSLAMVDIAA